MNEPHTEQNGQDIQRKPGSTDRARDDRLISDTMGLWAGEVRSDASEPRCVNKRKERSGWIGLAIASGGVAILGLSIYIPYREYGPENDQSIVGIIGLIMATLGLGSLILCLWKIKAARRKK